MATNVPPVQYKGAQLDAERGPGLGCFRFQLVVLAVLLVLTPLSVAVASSARFRLASLKSESMMTAPASLA